MAYVMLSLFSMTTVLLIVGGLWLVIASVLGIGLCLAAKRSMPAPTQDAKRPQFAPQAAECTHEPAYAVSAARHHA